MTTSFNQGFVRKQLLVDHPVQTEILKRLAFYGAAAFTYFLVILVISQAMANEGVTMGQCLLHCLDEMVFWAPGLMIMGPIAVYDLLRLTNRFAGPMFSLRREMGRLIEGQSERPLNFRDHDHWNEMSDLYNQIRQEMLLLRDENAQLKRDASKETMVDKLFDDEEDSTPDADLESAETELPLDDLVTKSEEPELVGV